MRAGERFRKWDLTYELQGNNTASHTVFAFLYGSPVLWIITVIKKILDLI